MDSAWPLAGFHICSVCEVGCVSGPDQLVRGLLVLGLRGVRGSWCLSREEQVGMGILTAPAPAPGPRLAASPLLARGLYSLPGASPASPWCRSHEEVDTRCPLWGLGWPQTGSLPLPPSPHRKCQCPYGVKAEPQHCPVWENHRKAGSLVLTGLTMAFPQPQSSPFLVWVAIWRWPKVNSLPTVIQ